jgi:Chaperone of endosialidase
MYKKIALLSIAFLIVFCYSSNAQLAVGAVAPNSTLDIRGSLAIAYRAFTTNTAAAITDNQLVFTGTTATALTLPTAVGNTGRRYVVKNASTTLPTPLVTITPAAVETIDGIINWLLDEANETVVLISDGVNWKVIAQNLPGTSGINWSQNGNVVGADKSIGTISNYDLPFITNNTEKFRLNIAGNAGLGTSTFDAVNPEKLLVDAGTTTSYNVISGKGSTNNYLQLNIQNRLAGTSASSDVVASNNTATESVNYIDMGINSSAFNNSTYPVLDGANNTYLYSTGNDFVIGNGTVSKDLVLFTGGFNAANERWRTTGTGFTGIGTAATTPTEKLQVEGNIRLSGINQSIFFDASADPYAGIKNISRTAEVNELMLFSGNDVTGTYGADRIRLASQELYFATTPASAGINTGDPSSFYENTTNVPTRMYINQRGNVAIGTTTFNTNKPEQLLVDAGTTTSYNVISGKGTYNNYLQLNIQNNSNGTSASSDIVATANNGSETTNYINLGINSSTYAGTGVTGGANTAYLYSTGNDFVIGNATNNKNVVFYTTVAGTSANRMSITNAGLIPTLNNAYTLGNTTKRSTAVWAVNGAIQTSDMRMKKNIHGLAYGLKEVLQLNPVSYNWIDDNDKANKIGLIAQEVKRIIPEVVIGDEKRERLGMNYAEMVPVLVNALQELKIKVDALRDKARAMNLIN